MNAAAVVLGYLWLSLVLFCVVAVSVLLAVSVVADLRSRWHRPPSNIIDLSERRDPSNLVRVIHGGGESA